MFNAGITEEEITTSDPIPQSTVEAVVTMSSTAISGSTGMAQAYMSHLKFLRVAEMQTQNTISSLYKG